MLMMCLVVCDVAVTITCMLFTLSPHPSLRGRQEESTKRRAHLYLIAGARYGRQQASGHIYIYIYMRVHPILLLLVGYRM